MFFCGSRLHILSDKRHESRYNNSATTRGKLDVGKSRRLRDVVSVLFHSVEVQFKRFRGSFHGLGIGSCLADAPGQIREDNPDALIIVKV